MPGPLIYLYITFIIILSGCGKTELTYDYPIKPVDFTQVVIDDMFWKPKLVKNREVTIPFGFRMCESTGRIDNFAIAAGLKTGSFRGQFPFDDSDVYKIIEGASYSLSQHYDAALDQYLDSLIHLIAEAQEPDGYLQTWRTINPNTPGADWWGGKERWSGMQGGHELYNLGHLYEASVSHFKATGKRTLLDIAIKSADLVYNTFGNDKTIAVPGHEEIEIGLVKLYRVTGNQNYLNLAKFFVDQRGVKEGRELWGAYNQDHMPVREQTEAVGHAVRAVYLYSAMADLAAISGDRSYFPALERIWEGIVHQKLYLTGGIGASREGESFGAPYQLPNAEAYSETCAAIAMVLWNHRMFLLTGDGKYIDILERSLYNNVISGVSFSGDRFFYPNPLESDGETSFNYGSATRREWFPCACCPSNISRILPSIPGYMYAVKGDTVYVNLFAKSRAEIPFGKHSVRIVQDTDFPENGTIMMKIDHSGKGKCVIAVRIPGWSLGQPVPGRLYQYTGDSETRQPRIYLNGEETDFIIEMGYAFVTKEWAASDELRIELPMRIKKVISNEQVMEDRDKVALERGPLVYCFEEIDNKGYLDQLAISEESIFKSEYDPDMLGGTFKIRVGGQGPVFTAIPYYKWSNRGENMMKVWVPIVMDQ